MYNFKKTMFWLGSNFKNKGFHRILIGIITFAITFIIVQTASENAKYTLIVGERSSYDIKAPRDIENKTLTSDYALKESNNISPEIITLSDVPIDVINAVNQLFIDFGITINNYRTEKVLLSEDQDVLSFTDSYIEEMLQNFNRYNVKISRDQIKYILENLTDNELITFESSFKGIISNLMKEKILDDNLPQFLLSYGNKIEELNQSQEIKNTEKILLSAFIKQNSAIDETKTEEKRSVTYERALELKQIIKKDDWIINKGDIVTKDIIDVITELKLLEDGKYDYVFSLGLLTMLSLLYIVMIIYLKRFSPEIFKRRKELLLIAIVTVIILLIAWVVSSYSVLLIPIFLATMILAIMLDVKIAIIMNFIFSILILFITKGDLRMLYVCLISGTLSAFIGAGAKQRSKLALTGFLIGAINTIIIIAEGIMRSADWSQLFQDSFIISLNGLLSVILTIGMMPFLEGSFNIITPIKLIELSNPNQPLIKRLLMEAPGTYHHSLMVGNLAEVATEEIKGNALLARVGAYYHDIGKLKRPNFFGENQMSENPHSRMTPNLSTLVITSHTNDGYELAIKHKLPDAIKDIIRAHHGTTLVSFFYYKAQKDDTWEEHKKENFRYDGPKPSTKEEAVVMLADTIEAAIRSMIHKTEGKTEGLVRKLIKDKLEDGQLDECELTLRDLDLIAKSFMKVFSGYYHKREEYPEVKANQLNINKPKPIKMISNIKKISDETIQPTVIIENLQTNIAIPDSINKTIKRVIETCLKHEKIRIGTEVNVLMVEDEEIKRINREQRNQDRVTDVLSFPLIDMFEGSMDPEVGDYDPDTEQLLLGDIVISVDTAKRQAEEYGHSFEREIAFLTAHSVFHLLGYDHKIEKDDKIMRFKQTEVLNELDLCRDDNEIDEDKTNE